jgi:hypothetical protein
MDTQERIAAALERIADALEHKNQSRINHQESRKAEPPFNQLEARLLEVLPSLRGRYLTMPEILAACGVKPGGEEYRSMGFILARHGFRQRRTARARYYIAE